jgi:hypothetical protein
MKLLILEHSTHTRFYDSQSLEMNSKEMEVQEQRNQSEETLKFSTRSNRDVLLLERRSKDYSKR